MPKLPRTAAIAPTLACALALSWGLVGGGCSGRRPPDELAQAVKMGERPVAMLGTSTFFGGTVEATATISRGIGRGLPNQGGRKGGGNGRSEVPDVSGMDNDEAMAYIRAKTAVGSPLPPVTLHLKLKNLGKTVFSVEILDFDSDMGNFAVSPALLSLAPDEMAEPEPMISQLGVTSDDIPVKVTLRKNGVKETQLIHVKSLVVPPPPK
jgi:hypothetical protein